MRTERLILFGTHFFCVLEWARFLHTWAFGSFHVNFANRKGANKQVRIAPVAA